MHKNEQDIIWVLKDNTASEGPGSRKIAYLHHIISHIDTPAIFSTVHELVNRNAITSKKAKILRAASREQLKPFRFLLNKN